MKKLNKVGEMRIKNGFSIGQLARMSGMAKSTIIRIENYEVDTTQSQMRRISRALNRKVWEVFDLSWL
ncbi:helix-turn-helix transcriptional regulator [Diplocloster modestus]|uniref:Helix-turn-helix domain-containing protein n=1 Tax=Diplocloster modestus TaxID=2850322 RepID=A0ABS6K100_9FIRM|nr:helix-turn-helix domain-containing protein [Diplocloster modestus]